ncbi:MAG TPA: DUF6675 family protein [Rectinemataceae bacterium]|nr:DUF6675 family protein [Rectinemataceae bacterium]
MPAPQNRGRCALVATLFSLCILMASAQSSPASALLDDAALGDIAAQGSASAVDNDGLPSLLPRLPSAQAIRAALAAEKPKVLVEALFLYPRPAAAGDEARRLEYATLFGLMRRISTLRGIEYYSHSDKKMDVLYVDASRVSGPDGRERLADEAPPGPSSVPASEELYALLQDQRFGTNVYKYRFRALGDAILVETTNETRMSYGIIPVFSPGQLVMRLLVIPASDGIIFYVESGANAPGFLRSRLGESFKNRAAALFGWFKSNFRAPPLVSE